MQKQHLYELSHLYRSTWLGLKDRTLGFAKSPILAFSLLVDNSPHGLECPKAHGVSQLVDVRAEIHQLTALISQLEALATALKEQT